jgi:hypothetical protein
MKPQVRSLWENCDGLELKQPVLAAHERKRKRAAIRVNVS